MPNCKSCGAEIFFARTVNGKTIPMDTKPEQRFILDESEDFIMALSRKTYQSHFSTCPNADGHRTKNLPGIK